VEEPVNGGELLPESAAPDPAPPPAWRFAFDRERHRRRALLRRLAALLGTGTLAFTLTTWLLLRHESRAPRLVSPDPPTAKTEGTPGGSATAAGEQTVSAALRTARAQLEALNQDDISGAYSYFSPAYRARVPLATFRRLVRAHRDMFHTEEQDVNMRSQSDDRVVLDIRVSSDDDEDYVAEFTLVRLNGKWCVDNLRWGFDDDTRSSA
jgi:hypothetical protein